MSSIYFVNINPETRHYSLENNSEVADWGTMRPGEDLLTFLQEMQAAFSNYTIYARLVSYDPHKTHTDLNGRTIAMFA